MIKAATDKKHASAVLSPPALTVSGEGNHLALSGTLEITTLAAGSSSLKKLSKQGAARSLDIARLESLDTTGALLLCNLRDKGVKLTGIRAEHQALLDLICGLDVEPLPKVKANPRWRQLVIELGKGADDAWHDAIDIITFVGR